MTIPPLKRFDDYAVVHAKSAAALTEKVQALLKDGWDPFGGLHGDERGYFREMVKHAPKVAKEPKIDPHAGEVWVKPPGFAGRWEKVDVVAR